MTIPLYQIDAFTDTLFAGNPAAVCLLERWLDDATLQAIAAENNLSETAFLVAEGEAYGLRWFTPTVEVELCGHATLASGFLLLEELTPERDQVAFETLSGRLTVRRAGDRLEMDFPAQPAVPATAPEALLPALGLDRAEVLETAGNYLVVVDSAAAARAIRPDFAILAGLAKGVIVSGPGDAGFDCVSRYFAAPFGIDEDPVTGSAHCVIAPYWAARLATDEITAFQASARGGVVRCRVAGDRVLLGGNCAFYLAGEIRLPADRAAAQAA